MATTNEWYQRAVYDYEDKVRDYSADLAFLNEQVAAAQTSLANLRAQRSSVEPGSEAQQVLLEQINNVASRRNELEARQTAAFNDLQQAQTSLAQARRDLERVNQGQASDAQPGTPAAPAQDTAAQQAQAPVTAQNNQLVALRQAGDVADTGEVPAVTVSDRAQTDPGEVPGETVFGPSFAQDTGGVPTQQLSTAPVPVAAQQPEFDEFPSDTNPDDTFAGNGYGFTYDDDGELLPFDSEAAENARAQPSDTQDTFAGDGYGFTYDEDGELIPSDSVDAERINNEATDFEYAGDGYGFEYDEDGELIPADDPFEPDTFDPDAVSPDSDPAIPTGQVGGTTADDIAPGNAAANQFRGDVNSTKQQAKIQERYNQTTQGDWRVRIRLLPESDYLYSDPQDAGILAPLRNIGVIFPYVPRVSTNYVANYDKYDLTHSNYRGYFYKNSSVQEITVEGDFTAQDTKEAEYTLAVIHFFRSVTKMFYGQDKYRGSPPPLVELSGFGQYQFNNHPCLVSQFQYSLPDNVDYIRVTPNNQTLSLANRRPAISSSPTPTVSSILRKITNGLNDGAEAPRQDLGVVQQTASGLGQTTYVPTKMRINITLLPVQNRQQVSQLFSLKEFANGRLLRGGFW